MILRTKRSTKKQVIQRIILLLLEKPRTINELAVEFGSNWDTTKENLELLKSINIVEDFKAEDGVQRFRTKTTEPIFLREDTLFGVPLNKKTENICKYLFKKVEDAWHKKTNVYPNKSQMQKTVVRIADIAKLPVPRGWYLFGKMCILEYDPLQKYDHEPIEEIAGLDKTINLVVDQFSKHQNVRELMEVQYKDNALYLNKLRLQELLNCEFDEETKKQIAKITYLFLTKFSKGEDDIRIKDILEKYVSVFNQILVYKTKNDLKSIRLLLQDSFVAIWELIGTYNLFNDLSEGNFGYERKELLKYFNKRIDTSIFICNQYLSELVSMLPKEKEIEDELSKFRGIQKIKRMPEEERKVLFEEFAKTDTSNIFGEANLN